MKKKIAISISIALFVVFVTVLVIGVFKQSKDNTDKSKEIEQIMLLEEDKAQAQRKIKDLEKKYNLEREEKPTLEFLFNKPSKEIYTSFYPVMKERKVQGVVAISPDEFPGKNLNMSKTQFVELLNEGWDYALYWNGKGNFYDFMREAKDFFSLHGLTMPQNIYFKSGTYSKKYDKTIEEYKFTTVIHSGEELLSLTQSNVKESIWKIGSYPAFASSKKVYNEFIRTRGNLIFVLDFYSDSLSNIKSKDIKIMFDTYKESAKENNSLITTISQARDIHFNISDSDKALKKKYINERKKLEEEIEKIDKQMRNIYYGQEK